MALVLSIFLGVNSSGVSAASDDSQQDGAYRQINVYSEVLRHMQTDYVEEPNITSVTNGALRGLLESSRRRLQLSHALGLQDLQGRHHLGKAQVGINVSKRVRLRHRCLRRSRKPG